MLFHKTASSASLVIQKSVPTLLTHISPNSRPFLVGIVSGELQHRTSFIPLIGLQTDFLATGQTGDDIFNSTPINPDLDDPEQLTGESIQSFLTLVVQLQWIVATGRLVIHAQVTSLSKLKLTQKKLQKTYGYILQINEFYWTQSKYYLHETLIKHWDPFKFLKILMTYDGIILISRPTFMDISISSKQMGYLQHLTQVSIIYTHTHTSYIYISTFYYACQHKNMLHPPQEGSNRSLAYGTLLGVLW